MSDIVTVIQTPLALVTTIGGGQGPAGPAGPQGLPGGTGASYTTSGPISGNTVVVLNAAGLVEYASSDNLGHSFKVVGVTSEAAIGGAPIAIQQSGVMEFNGWTWTPDSPVFVGLNGVPTQLLPGSSTFSQVIGKALSATRLLIGLQPPIAL